MTAEPLVRIQKEPEFRDLPIPKYASADAAGFDLHAAVRSEVVLKPRQWRLISTGIRVAIPAGFEGQVRPRSGLALKYGVTLLNSPGTVDADYRGIVGVIVINLGEEPFRIKRGDRIAQMVITPIQQVIFEEVESLKPTSRGSSGFGSTGTTQDGSKTSNVTAEERLPMFDDEYARENDITLPGGTGK